VVFFKSHYAWKTDVVRQKPFQSSKPMSKPATTHESNTPIELYRRGITALQQQLGPVDSIRFLHLLDHGAGDYTAERQAQNDEISLTDLCSEIRSSTPATAS
jgi:hypothetical protein